MKEWFVTTNFGHTYKWSRELIAKDYADTAIQWQDEDDIEEPKSHKELYNEILNDDDWLTQWFCDYIQYNIDYSMAEAELVNVDQKEYDSFVRRAIDLHGGCI